MLGRFLPVVLFIVLCGASVEVARASDPAIVYYSRGVAAFVDEDWRRAEAYFDRTITYAPSQPRAYYFRGLARNHLGRKIEAESDIRQGAALEATKDARYRIGSALASLEGDDRKLLDGIRTEMLGNVPSRRYSADMPGGAERATLAMRPRFHLPLEALDSIASPQDLSRLAEAARPVPGESQLAQDDPFIDDPLPPAAGDAPPAKAMAASPKAQQTGMMIREFTRMLSVMWYGQGNGAMPGISSGGPFGGPADGFGGPPGPMGDGSFDAEVGEMAGDPFGGGDDAGLDPFGGGAAGDEDPFGSDAGGDPFGAPAAQPDEAMPAEDSGFDDSGADDAADDPFGGEDPFGGGEDPFG